jgi:predicted AlkP superfamily pyrophosphatase or phosphodiesterase
MIMRLIFRWTTFVVLFLTLSFCVPKKENSHADNVTSRPKLVVGIVVDQMRQEYLSRYYSKFSDGGFKRLLRDGFENKNTHYNYIPTKTAPGHAAIFTGTTPSLHGIIGNSWYDRGLNRELENIEDTVLNAFSPRNLLASTITDELRLSTQLRSKVVGVSIKDRGAILPAGHLPNGAYWYDEMTGEFVSSIYYHKVLPEWLLNFNKRNLADSLLNGVWDTTLPIAEYTESGPDDSPYETVLKGQDKAVFPYQLKELRSVESRISESSFGPKIKAGFKLLPVTPFGNTITTMIAIAALKGESLGKDADTDFLTISYSSTDKAGHAFGPQSVEVEDVYIRLDLELANLLNVLDEEVGKGNYLIFLTADHAVAEVPQFLVDHKIPAGLIDEDKLKDNVNSFLIGKYGVGEWIMNLSNEQLFLNTTLLAQRKIDKVKIIEQVCEFLIGKNGIANAYPATFFQNGNSRTAIEGLLNSGYHRKRSGDVLMVYEPGWVAHDKKGTTHGSGYNYDTHVPLLWYGWGIKPGRSHRHQTITDIAPTLSFLLDVKLPNAASGQPILELLGDR